MTHKLATGENFDIVRGNQTVRVPFDATDPQSAQVVMLVNSGGLRYNLALQSSTAFDDREVQPLALSAASTAVTLPALTSGKVADFIVDVTNGTASDAAIELTGWGTTYSLMVDKRLNAGDLLTFAAGDKARLYFTLTAFTDTINNATVPVWQLSRKDVKIATANGGN